MGNQELENLHLSLKNDEAYIYSIKNNDVYNLMMVLRAYGYNHNIVHANTLLSFAIELGDI